MGGMNLTAWLYQINQKEWDPNRYRVEIWEGERWSWPVGRISPAGASPRPGDIVVFFYAPTGGHEPGFYGWAVVLEWYRDSRTLYFRPVAPSDRLKMHPWWDAQARKLADQIRGRMKQGTFWSVSEAEARDLQQGISTWAGWRRP